MTVSSAPEKLLLAAPRGYCAGVDRAVQTVERALEVYGPPVYVRKEIVHNKHVVEQLRARSAITDDHTPFLAQGVPAIDLIQWPYDCWHERCDDLTAVSQRSLDQTGETVLELVRTLG